VTKTVSFGLTERAGRMDLTLVETTNNPAFFLKSVSYAEESKLGTGFALFNSEFGKFPQVKV